MAGITAVYAINVTNESVTLNFNNDYNPPNVAGVTDPSKAPTNIQKFAYDSASKPKGKFGNQNTLITSYQDATWMYTINLDDYTSDLQLYVFKGWVILSDGGDPTGVDPTGGTKDQPIQGTVPTAEDLKAATESSAEAT